MLLFGAVLLLVSVLGGGRDARVAAWHGGLTALCLLSSGAHLVALLAAAAALFGGIGFSVWLRQFEVTEQMRSPWQQGGAVLLVALGLAAVSGAGGVGSTAFGFGTMLAGLQRFLTGRAVFGQALALLFLADGMLLLAGVSGSPGFLCGAVGLDFGVFGLCAVVMRRLVWRVNADG